jgi:hypothetical protein
VREEERRERKEESGLEMKEWELEARSQNESNPTPPRAAH